jgi:hypothetical protein
LGHDLGKCSPAQIVTLRGIYGAIKDGEATWQTVMQNKADQGPGAGVPPAEKKLEACTAEAFDKKKAGWKKLIDDKKQTAKELISTVGTKHALTPGQIEEIQSWEVVAPAAPVQSQSEFNAGLAGDDEYIPQ